jgi:hypothetical protein
MLRPGLDSSGYRRAILYETDGKGRKPFRIHSLLGLLYLPPFKGDYISFKDKNKRNIKLSNLEWVKRDGPGIYQYPNGNWKAVSWLKGRKRFHGFHRTREAALDARKAALRSER